ncbi:MAG: sugar ABC transporter ATP-binding protein [Devosia sp.]
MTDTVLSIRDVGKNFFGVTVLSNVSLDVGRGRVLGLVGQNGAGKSTLMNIVGGNLRSDTGSMEIDGAPYSPASAREAEHRGVAFIHQELNLFSNLSIAENIFISAMPRGPGGLVDRRELRRRTASLLAEVELDLSPDTLVERLSPGERQLVEVTKALQLDANIVIFDEPTTSLTPRETTKLFALIRRLREAGKAVIYISHILADIENLADDVAVLRDGRLVEFGVRADLPAARMINLMLGRDIDQLYPPHKSVAEPAVLLEARALSLRGVIKDVSFSLQRGEVLGFFGLMGAGRTELARILFGLDRFDQGELRINGQPMRNHSAEGAIRAGMAFITENRREEGLMMNASIAENIALASLTELSNLAGVIDGRTLVERAGDFATKLQIKSGAIGATPARSLSGGNQQKVVIAKWLMSRPVIFLLDEPTRGIDVAAKYEIYSIINDLAASGSSVIFISSEIEEVMAMADRILVMRQGEISGEFTRDQFRKEGILRAAFGEQEKVA